MGIRIRDWPGPQREEGRRNTYHLQAGAKGEEIFEMVQWSMLPMDLLQLIADLLLVNLGDYIRYRTVCKSWRDASVDQRHYNSSLPRQHPWIMLSFDEFKNDRSFLNCYDHRVIKFHLPEAGNKRILGSTGGWLVLVSEALEIRLLNPLTRVQIPLPAMHEILNIVDYNEHDVGKEFKVLRENGRISRFDSYRARDFILGKVMVSSIEASRHVLVMAIKYSGTLFLTRLGDNDWKAVDQEFVCSDMVCFQGRTYVVDIKGALAVCDYGPPPKLTPITAAIGERRRKWYIVESLGELLLVRRRYKHQREASCNLSKKTKRFKVYKVDLENQQTKRADLNCWGDRILFLGANDSISVSSRDFPELGGGCICFTASCFRVASSNEEFYVEGDDFGIFNAKDKSINAYYEDCSRFVWPPPFWFTPRLP